MSLRTSFPEKALYYYLHNAYPDAIANANKTHLPWLGEMELDIYIPSLRLGIEYDGPLHTLQRDQKKNERCAANNVGVIRVRDARLSDELTGSRNIKRRNQREEALTEAVLEVLGCVSEISAVCISMDVDINRDRSKIRALQGLSDEKSAASCL